MRDYARGQTALLLRLLAGRARAAAHSGDDVAVHDLRVAIRRMRRCVQEFAQFYPRHSWKPLRRRLRKLMDACGKVRDRDVAIALLEKAGVAAEAPLVARLGEERQSAERELGRELRRCVRRGFRRKWRLRLGV